MFVDDATVLTGVIEVEDSWKKQYDEPIQVFMLCVCVSVFALCLALVFTHFLLPCRVVN